MINSGNFAPNPPWVHKNQKNKNKNKNEETVGAVLTKINEEHETETDSEDSELASGADSESKNEPEDESEDELEDKNEIVSEDTGGKKSTRTTRLEHILACIEAGQNGDGSDDADITEEEYYNRCDVSSDKLFLQSLRVMEPTKMEQHQ